jgi:hypothetical protein
VGLTLRWRRGGDSPLLGLAASAALLPLAYAANLASTGGWAALRTVGAASAVAWTLASAGALEIGGRFGPRGRAAALALLAAAVLAQAGQIHWRVPPPVVGLTLEEIEIVRTRLRELPRGFRFVVFRRPAWSDPGASLVVYDEIGTPSSTAEWVPESMLRRVHRDLTGQPLRARVEVLAPDDPLPGRGLVVDMGRELRRRARQRAEADRPKGGGS